MIFAKAESHYRSPPEGSRRPNVPRRVEGNVFSGDNTLAFNLASEWDRAKEHGNKYKGTFLDNARFYAGETYLKGRAAVYEYRVADNGELVYPNSDIRAVKSFQKPSEDMSRPAWLRQRDQNDLAVVKQIESSIKTAQIGDTWIAASPAIAESEVPQDTRQEWGYGRHSFMFLHQLQIDPISGQKKLVCRALRHYLSEDAQRELVSRLGGRAMPSDAKLHGYVAKLSQDLTPRNFKVQDSLHVAHIHSVGNKIAEEKGEMYWENGRGGLLAVGDVEKQESESMMQISKLDWWLEDVYRDILDLGQTPSLSSLKAIESKFRGWEVAVKAICDGKGVDQSLFATKQSDDQRGSFWRESMAYNDPRLGYIKAALSAPGGIGTCGIGSGFGVVVPGVVAAGEASAYGIHPLMSSWNGVARGVVSAEYKSETSTHHESYQCPKCKSWYAGEKKDSPRSSWRKKCDSPSCNHKFNC